MKAAPVIKTLREGVMRLEVRAYADGRFGFDYAPPGKTRIKVRLKDQAEAIERGKEMIAEARAGKLVYRWVDADLFAEFLIWRAAQKPKATVPALAADLIKSRADKGRSNARLRELRGVLEPFAKAFPGNIHELTREDVEKWLNTRNVGARRWNNMREVIVTLHKYARRGGYLGADLTPVESIEPRGVSVNVGTYTPEELTKLLRATPEEWLPLVVLGAFAGVRPEELCPDLRSDKPRLQWENILWDKRKLDVPKEVSKVRRRRFVPLCDAAMAFLAPYRKKSGPITPAAVLHKQSSKWAKAAGVKWVPDGLRHSYASYRLALLKDIQELALEMGNSPRMIHTHYLDLKHEDEAEQWFAIRPE